MVTRIEPKVQIVGRASVGEVPLSPGRVRGAEDAAVSPDLVCGAGCPLPLVSVDVNLPLEERSER